MHTMRRGYCSKLSGQMENLDHNKRATLRYEKQESMTFNPTRSAEISRNLDPTRGSTQPVDNSDPPQTMAQFPPLHLPSALRHHV
jgi:hypothetical protein